MTCGEVSREVKRSQSCRGSHAPCNGGRKVSLVHFQPVRQTREPMSAELADCNGERLRNFESTKRGRIVNRGDSFRRQRDAAATRQTAHTDKKSVCVDSGTLQRSTTLPSMPDPLRERGGESRGVLLLGSPGVGRSALCRQFQTSEYTNGSEHTSEGEENQRPVAVRLDGTETRLTVRRFDNAFSQTLDHCPPSVASAPQALEEADGRLQAPDSATLRLQAALVVVYSVVDTASFLAARQLCQLVSVMSVRRPVILVANKSDLVRLRKVSSKEGRLLAVEFGFKYIETSVVLNLNIDELLAGIVAQIRFYHQLEDSVDAEDSSRLLRQQKRREKRFKSRTLPSTIVKELLQKVIGHKELKDCDNLLAV